MADPWWWLILGLVSSTLLPSCCCDPGPPRLTFVERIEPGVQQEFLGFDGRVNELTKSVYFRAFRVGGPEDAPLTTIPMLELYDRDGQKLALQRFTDINDGGCAAVEIYEPLELDLVIGDSYSLVHRASASPGDIEDSGISEGDLAAFITTFGGERSLVAKLVVVEPVEPLAMGGAGAEGGGGTGGDAAAGGAGGAG